MGRRGATPSIPALAVEWKLPNQAPAITADSISQSRSADIPGIGYLLRAILHVSGCPLMLGGSRPYRNGGIVT